MTRLIGGSRQQGREARPAAVEWKRLGAVQWAALIGSGLILMWSIPGLIVNPDFGVGEAAHSELVLGSDMNGWHAVSGFVVVIPALLLLRRPELEAVYLVLAAASLIATGVWALLETQPAGGLFSFPHNGTDALLHFGTSAIFLAGAIHWFLTSRPTPRSSAA